jgi:hypothetical protein
VTDALVLVLLVSATAGVSAYGFYEIGKRITLLEKQGKNLYSNDLNDIDRWEDLREELDELQAAVSSLEMDVNAVLGDPFEDEDDEDEEEPPRHPLSPYLYEDDDRLDAFTHNQVVS